MLEKFATGVCEKALIDVTRDSKNNNICLNCLVLRLIFIRLNFVNPSWRNFKLIDKYKVISSKNKKALSVRHLKLDLDKLN